MKKRLTIEVKDKKEAQAIAAGLADPAVRAFVVVMGALSGLPTDRARKRVLSFVADTFDEDALVSRAEPDTEEEDNGK